MNCEPEPRSPAPALHRVLIAVFAFGAACSTLPDAADAPRVETLASQLGLAIQSARDSTGAWPTDGSRFLRHIGELRRSPEFQADTVSLSVLPEPVFISDLRMAAQPDGSLRVKFRSRTTAPETFEFLVSTNKVTLSPGVTSRPRQP